MFRKVTAASGVVLILAIGGFTAPAVFANSGLTPGSGETSATPHASPGKTTRTDAKQQVAPARADGTLGANVGEASRSPDRTRASAKSRAQVKQETRDSRADRKTADGFERVGGEAGTRSVPPQK